ncbi:unnamed protein product [Paramecium primaurelia]|uniref:Uncharacterized protein n=1 Tax=Paramecium primaurelia TaxID=5886 RepID=A0A8S1Q4R9_PARPR|nr:unnamed protein product [Paramecium primaurelia]
MLFTFILLGFVNSSCLTRNFEECLSLNVEYQESCQLSQGECRPRPEKCTEIDATYPLNCRTNECYYSKRFNKCLSQPFTRLLNEVADRGDHHDHQQDSHDGIDQQRPQPTEQGPLPPPYQPPQNPPQYPLPPQNDQQIEQPIEEDNNDSLEDDEEDSYEEEEEQDINQNTSDEDESWNEPEVPSQPNSTNTTNSTNNTNNNSNNNNSDGFNDTYEGFQNIIEEEIKFKLSQSDENKQIEIKSSGTNHLIMAFITMIIWI